MWQCDNCGYRINGGATHDIIDRHQCHPDGIVRTQLARLDQQFAEYLDTSEGRFAVHYALRRLQARAGDNISGP